MPPRISRRLLGMLGLCLFPVATFAANAPAVACESLVGKAYYNIRVTAAAKVAATGNIPTFCKVSGHEPGTDHDLEVRLPDQWRGRYVQRGGGGFDGSIPPVAFSQGALNAGAVQGANNGGHRDPSGAALLNNPRAVDRYAHTAILTATRFGKAVTKAYYGSYPQYSYYEGCSNGGRGALNAAAKYGNEFDGVIAVAPTTNLSGQIAQWTSAAALTMPTADQFKQVHAAAVAKCDAMDGAKDGIVSHWQACQFDASKDVPSSVGLSAAHVQAINTIMSEVKDSAGNVIYAGFGTGDLSFGAPAYAMFGTGQMRSIILNDANWSAAQFRMDQHLPLIKKVIDEQHQFSAANSDLIQFMRGKGKIIIWHGADDALLSHKDTIRSWQSLNLEAGKELMSANSRLYIAPGVNHCAGGAGADQIDSLAAMIDWVERGKPPATLLAKKIDAASGATKFTRPLCEFPAWPRYSGKGDVNDAAQYSCVRD
jgi:pimeloyl-ACP methyl ester carboxylesterase